MALSKILFLSLLCTLQLQALTFVNLSGVNILISPLRGDGRTGARHLKVSNNTAINTDITGMGDIRYRLSNMDGDETSDLPKVIGNFTNNDFIVISGINAGNKTFNYEKTDKLILGKSEADQKKAEAREARIMPGQPDLSSLIREYEKGQ